MNEFIINQFYTKEEIQRGFQVGARGGIRPNSKKNLIVLFMDSSTTKNKDYGRNIYDDSYDKSLGIFKYNGEGQIGDQKFQRGNKWLRDSKKNSTKIHLFFQFNPYSKHQYMGLVEVIDYDDKVIQPDANQNNRKTIMFFLKPLSNPNISEEESFYREIDSEIANKSENLTIDELEDKIQEISNTLKHRKPSLLKRIQIFKEEYVRRKLIIKYLKIRYNKECQVCGYKFFIKRTGQPYSEVHHLIRWVKSHDDSKENLVVICANCHTKFHHSVREEIDLMYNHLIRKFPEIMYNQPSCDF